MSDSRTPRPCPHDRPRSWRSRWAAIGAAVAVVLGLGGPALVDATITSGDRPVFIAITPCRLIDTRPATAVGPRTTPLGPNETVTLAVRGTNGNCTIPNDALSVVANATIVNPTAQSHLIVYPADASRPTASNLNWLAGQSPTPNQVTARLSTTGAIRAFNRNGSVDLILDIVGYYAHHTHDDRYYTETQTDNRIAAAQPEIIVTDGVSVNLFSLDSTSTFGGLDETITTSIAGRLEINKLFIGNGQCGATGSTGRAYYLTVDGVGVRSSLVYFSNADQFRGRLLGVTEAVLPAGSHTIRVAWECLNDDPTGASSITISNSHVIVHPASS